MECGYACSGENPDFCEPTCGDGVQAGNEDCDDHNTDDDDGCSADCTLEAGYSCALTECGLSDCIPVCGNGVRTPLEDCDDGNSIDGD